MNMQKRTLILAIAIPAALFLLILLFAIPAVNERVSYHFNEWKLRVAYALNPPEEVVFVPQEAGGQGNDPDSGTLMPSATFTPTMPTATETPTGPTETPLPTETPEPTATPLPSRVDLKGVRYDDQHGRFNYCAPATLSMALSFWGWDGNRDVVGPVIKPDPKDKNVMPYEMVNYVEGETGLKALLRYAGDIDTAKRFIAAGFPVTIEKGVYFNDLSGVVSWMGHYEVFNGYDDEKQVLIGQDAYIGPDQLVPYDVVENSWRAFNYVYMVIYPPEREAEVMALLGEDADENFNYHRAAQRASDEIFRTSGIDRFFAWFNRGSSLVLLQDYAGAAQAFDEAFAIYPEIPEKDRPWRMVWYVTAPYFAYYHSGRYYDALSLAEKTLATIQGDKNLEESYYWRAMARAALGDTGGAAEDFRLSLKYHPGFAPALYQLSLLGVEP
jgi:tetratricopeptide (TPR) repeat protein